MKLTFEGENFADVAAQMLAMLAETSYLIARAEQDDFEEEVGRDALPETEEVPEPKKTRKTKPKPEPEPAGTDDETSPEPSDEEGEDLAAVKKEALDKLMTVYLEGSDAQKAEIKELLKQFDVKKFSDVPEDRAKELLAEAEKL